MEEHAHDSPHFSEGFDCMEKSECELRNTTFGTKVALLEIRLGGTIDRVRISHG